MTRDLVLVGGGHTHAQVLAALAEEPIEETRLTVVVDRRMAIYSGMVPGFVAGQYREEELGIDVEALGRRAGARVILAPARAVDAERRQITLDAERRQTAVEAGPPLRYDVASLNIGSTVAGLEIPGVRDHALPTRPIADFVHRVDGLVAEAARGIAPGPFRVVVVGAGAGGVELSFCLQRRLRSAAVREVEVRLIDAGGRLLPGYPESLARRVRRHAARRGIEIEMGRAAVAVEGGRVVFEDGGGLLFDALVWVTGAASHPLARRSELPTDRRGFVRVRPTLQVAGHDELFAAGDCAALEEDPETPKAGVYAVRQGPVLTRNLRALLAGRPLESYRPQADFLTLLNLGDGVALGAKWGLSFEGRWVMRLKDRIDRRFVERFRRPQEPWGPGEPARG